MRFSVFLRQHRIISIFGGICLTVVLFTILFHWIVMPRQLFDQPTSTVMYDNRGELLCARIAADEQWRFPSSDTVDSRFVTCLLNYEDRRFRYHLGVDLIAIGRALKRNLQGGRREGGSTLTMQLARMARGNHPRTFKNKIIEALWAFDIELTHSKDEILKMYVANAPFGGNIVGLEAASWRYFNRGVDKLSWAELCTLAVLPNSPALIHLSRNRGRLKKKRDTLLKILYHRGVLSQEEYNLSCVEDLPDTPYPLPNNAPHFIDFMSKKQKGNIIHTSIDTRLQRMVQYMSNSYAIRYHISNQIDNIAILVLDIKTGEPIVYVGNTTNRDLEASQVDVIQAERSPGSTLKPFLYAAMMSCGELTPRRLISDTPLSLNGFTPINFSHTYSGAVHADDAIIQSLNVPLVRMLSEHTTGRFMEDLKWLGMTTLHYNEDHYGASLILGGAEVKLWDLCCMYRKLAYRLKLGKARGKEAEKERISRVATWFAFQAMSKLNRPEEEAEWMQFRSMKNIAWKTGTSWGNRDAWSVGVSSKYVVGVWVGNATGEGRAGMTGVGFASPVMFDVFSMLDDDAWYTAPYDEMEQMKVCRRSGCLASDICAETDKVYLPKASKKTLQCSYCQWVHLSKDEQWQVNSSCVSPSEMVTKSWFVLPAAQEYYYKSCHAGYRPLPAYRDDCQGTTVDQIDFIYPEHNATIMIPRGFEGEKQQVVCKAVCRRSTSTLYWHIDNQYLGETKGNHQLTISPDAGAHILSIVDEVGNRKAIRIFVR